MKKIINTFLAMSLLLGVVIYPQEKRFPAFPGAEGFGAYTPGGRGGKVIYVTTLEDYNPKNEKQVAGSLRDAVDTKGPRTILFKVGGVIKLKTSLTVKEPFLTIAGQTAPGGGICINGYTFGINTHDVIIRYIRSRFGDENKVQSDAMSIGRSKNIIVDHCSASWSVDEDFSTQLSEGGITVQWSIISESLNNSVHHKGKHGYGSIISGPATYHHNLYAHNYSRNPRPNMNLVDFRNNVIYDYGFRPGYSGRQPVFINYVGNYLKPGPSTKENVREKAFLIGGPETQIYFDDVSFFNEPKDSKPIPHYVSFPKVKDGKYFLDNSTDAIQKATISYFPFPCAPVATDESTADFEKVLNGVGATLPVRDAIDTRIIKEVRTGTGKIIDSQKEVGGLPEYKNGTPSLDSDSDGMPDEWEMKNGFDPNDVSDNNKDFDNDGFTNLEEYLNNTNPKEKFVWIDYPEIYPANGDVFLNSTEVKMDYSTPDVEIRYTNDGSEPDVNSQLYGAPVILSSSTLIKAKAFDKKGNSSYTNYKSFVKEELLPSIKVENTEQGLDYLYYESDGWRRLSVVYELPNYKSDGKSKNFDISVGERERAYGLRFFGYIDIPNDGMYTFYDEAASGSNIYIGEKLIVDNSGKHDVELKTGKVALSKGLHPITVSYFIREEKGEPKELKISYEGPGMERQEIPDRVLFRRIKNN